MSTLYLICGMFGSGKTTLTKKLEVEKSAFRLCPDEWIKEIIQNEDDISELDRLRDPVEKLQWDLAKSLLGEGINVALENGFWSQEERSEYRKTAKALGAQVVLHYLDLPKRIILARVASRNRKLPDGSFHVSVEDVEGFMVLFEPPLMQEMKTYDEYIIHSI